MRMYPDVVFVPVYLLCCIEPRLLLYAFVLLYCTVPTRVFALTWAPANSQHVCPLSLIPPSRRRAHLCACHRSCCAQRTTSRSLAPAASLLARRGCVRTAAPLRPAGPRHPLTPLWLPRTCWAWARAPQATLDGGGVTRVSAMVANTTPSVHRTHAGMQSHSTAARGVVASCWTALLVGRCI